MCASALLALESLSKQRLGREAVARSGALQMAIEVMRLHPAWTATQLVRGPLLSYAPRRCPKRFIQIIRRPLCSRSAPSALQI